MNQIKLDNYVFNYQVFFNKIKHVYLRIEKDYIKVTCHPSFSQDQIEAFLYKHKRWIINRLSIEKKDIYNLKSFSLWGQEYKVRVNKNISRSIYLFDSHINIKSDTIDGKVIEHFYRNETLKEIKQIIEDNKELLKQYFNIDQLTFKAQLMKSRLGSCITQKKIIKLNSILARLDKKYLKLVLFHELVHLSVQNHSKNFHDLLEILYKNHRLATRQLNHEIKKYKM